ncbi:translation initiation factor IF-2-like [Mustela erminea]|uniref:translation initiation factor IF-2-like n=1 Tax=Mustela erminea TaxID=36723 RepID=UPI0013872B46|nr:translation initiation factor IF-2-like [Mustela erminea]
MFGPHGVGAGAGACGAAEPSGPRRDSLAAYTAVSGSASAAAAWRNRRRDKGPGEPGEGGKWEDRPRGAAGAWGWRWRRRRGAGRGREVPRLTRRPDRPLHGTLRSVVWGRRGERRVRDPARPEAARCARAAPRGAPPSRLRRRGEPGGAPTWHLRTPRWGSCVRDPQPAREQESAGLLHAPVCGRQATRLRWNKPPGPPRRALGATASSCSDGAPALGIRPCWTAVPSPAKPPSAGKPLNPESSAPGAAQSSAPHRGPPGAHQPGSGRPWARCAPGLPHSASRSAHPGEPQSPLHAARGRW